MSSARPCSKCAYWQPEEPFDEGDPSGECRRRSPPTFNRVEHQMASMLGQLAWAVHQKAGMELRPHEERDFDPDGNATDHAIWPITSADDWCGEFVARVNID